MSGIIVGIDGSGHSQRALEWAMKEAAIRHTPLTVLTVNEAVAGYFGGVTSYADDPARTERGRLAAQAESDKVLASLDGTPRNASGFKAKRLKTGSVPGCTV
ncbi:MAG: universal stress protein [Streptosporangiaceae bacterium]